MKLKRHHVIGSSSPVGSEETITFSKEVTKTGATRRCLRKTCRKKHPKRKEIRKEEGQQKPTARFINRIVMATDGGNEYDNNDTGSGPSPPGRTNKDDTSVAEAHELFCDRLRHKFKFEEAGQEEASEYNDDSSDSGTDEDIPTMVG